MAAAGNHDPLLIRRAFAELSGGQVHYARCGPRGDPAVLLLHQSPRSWAEYRAVMPRLGSRYDVIAMDTVGFGESSPWPGAPSIERWAVAVSELLDVLRIPLVNVVGHHTGGVVAVELAAAFGARVRSLVLSSTPYTDEAFRRARAERPPIDEVAPSDDGSHLAALWQKRRVFYPADRPDLLEAFVLDALKVGARLEEGHRAVASYRMEERIGAITQPVLILRATHDPFAAPHADELRERLRQARIVDIEGGMVPLPDQMPEAFAHEVLRFLDGLG